MKCIQQFVTLHLENIFRANLLWLVKRILFWHLENMLIRFAGMILKLSLFYLSESHNFYFDLKANKINARVKYCYILWDIANCKCNEVHMDTLKAKSDPPIDFAYLDDCMSCIQINTAFSHWHSSYSYMTGHRHLHHLCRQVMTSKIYFHIIQYFLLLVSSAYLLNGNCVVFMVMEKAIKPFARRGSSTSNGSLR